MFKTIRLEMRGIRGALEGIRGTLKLASDSRQEPTGYDGVLERVASLEGTVESLRGEIAGSIIQAEALKATARAAEDRARGHMKRAEKYEQAVAELEGGEDEDPFETIGRAYQDLLPTGDDEGEQALPAVSNGVAERRQSLTMARQAKRRGA